VTPGKFSCDAPGCTFTSNSLKTIKSHKLGAHTLDRRKCHLCGMVLKHFSTKVTHLNKHGTPTEGLFKCLFRSCTNTCIKSELKKHMGQHLRGTKDLSFECEHCVRSFANRQGLVTHLNKHFTKTPGQWKCVFAACKSLFLNSTDLKHHAQIHLKTPHLLCSECDKFFPTDLELKQHK
jgi:hypothetical protein